MTYQFRCHPEQKQCHPELVEGSRDVSTTLNMTQQCHSERSECEVEESRSAIEGSCLSESEL